MTFEECCDTFAVAVESSKVQHGQPVLTLSDPGFRPERKTRLQTKRVITDRCHDRIVVEEPDTWKKSRCRDGADFSTSQNLNISAIS